eukprot:Rhum_TRINITY_DN14233_c28_g1::Rhum_TRINITY_DN14233_c28_g1_i1::g.76338::m.76338
MLRFVKGPPPVVFLDLVDNHDATARFGALLDELLEKYPNVKDVRLRLSRSKISEMRLLAGLMRLSDKGVRILELDLAFGELATSPSVLNGLADWIMDVHKDPRSAAPVLKVNVAHSPQGSVIVPSDAQAFIEKVTPCFQKWNVCLNIEAPQQCRLSTPKPPPPPAPTPAPTPAPAPAP